MSIDGWVLTALIGWGFLLLLLIVSMMKAASDQDDDLESLYDSLTNERETDV